jgi:peptidoglycan hydrolase-like protein with peptidoglycan-binding domain
LTAALPKRLRHLGYYPRVVDPDDPPNDELDDWAIKAFQMAQGRTASSTTHCGVR